MIDHQVLAFTAVAALLTIIPGADTMMVLRSVLARGRRAGLWTVWGVCSGLFVHATLSAVGVSALLLRSALLFDIVRLAGAAYIIWLGLRSLLSRKTLLPDVPLATSPATPIADRYSPLRAWLEGFLTNVLNPKVAIFYLALLPQFVSPQDPVLAKSILLATIHFMLGTLWLSTVVVLVGALGNVLTRVRVRRRLEQTTGAMLIALGLGLVLERR